MSFLHPFVINSSLLTCSYSQSHDATLITRILDKCLTLITLREVGGALGEIFINVGISTFFKPFLHLESSCIFYSHINRAFVESVKNFRYSVKRLLLYCADYWFYYIHFDSDILN